MVNILSPINHLGGGKQGVERSHEKHTAAHHPSWGQPAVEHSRGVHLMVGMAAFHSVISPVIGSPKTLNTCIEVDTQ